MSEHTAEKDAVALRYFIDGQEVTEADAFDAEDRGTAKVTKGGSGVVPEDLRQPGETRDQWLRPWLAMESTSASSAASAVCGVTFQHDSHGYLDDDGRTRACDGGSDA